MNFFKAELTQQKVCCRCRRRRRRSSRSRGRSRGRSRRRRCCCGEKKFLMHFTFILLCLLTLIYDLFALKSPPLNFASS